MLLLYFLLMGGKVMESNKHCGHIKEDYCIKRVPIFGNLTNQEMFEISKTIQQKEYKKGEIIYLEGEKIEKLFIINSGQVKIYNIAESGREQIIRILSPGDFIDELSILTNSPANNIAETIVDTTMCMITGEDLKRIMEKKPVIALKVIQELGRRLEKTEKLIQSIGLMSVEKRIADSLLDMANEKDVVHLTITKKDLASHIGMSQETLSRKLSSFQDLGWIKQQGQRKIIIKDKKALENIK